MSVFSYIPITFAIIWNEVHETNNMLNKKNDKLENNRKKKIHFI